MRGKRAGLIWFVLSALPALAGDRDEALAAYASGQYEQALNLFTPLAKGGDVEAQMALSDMYKCGLGVPVDPMAAVAWARRAAKRDHPAAIYNLGVLALNGFGMETDPIEATRLFVAAAELNSPDALYLLGGMYLQIAPATDDIQIGIDHLGRAAAMGQPKASELLRTVMQELPDIPHDLIRTALELHTAIAAGCDELGGVTPRAIAVL